MIYVWYAYMYIIYMYVYIYSYTYVTGEILVKGWRLLPEKCLSFRKNAAHFEDSLNLKQYRLHHVQGNAAFFSQKCCGLLGNFLHTATRHSLTSKRHAFPMRMICWKILSMEYSASSQGKKLDCLETVCTVYGNRFFWKDSCMSKDLKGNTMLFICGYCISWKTHWKLGFIALLSQSCCPLRKWCCTFLGKVCSLKMVGVFQTECLNRVWSDNCFPQRTLLSRARVIA